MEVLDTKQQVLAAIYTEYQKDLPEMKKAITPENLGLDRDVLYVTIEKLQNEGYITDAHLTYGGQGHRPLFAVLDGMKMTRDGIGYIEQKADVDPHMNNAEKLTTMRRKFAEWGIERLENIAAKTLAEIIKGSIT